MVFAQGSHPAANAVAEQDGGWVREDIERGRHSGGAASWAKSIAAWRRAQVGDAPAAPPASRCQAASISVCLDRTYGLFLCPYLGIHVAPPALLDPLFSSYPDLGHLHGSSRADGLRGDCLDRDADRHSSWRNSFAIGREDPCGGSDRGGRYLSDRHRHIHDQHWSLHPVCGRYAGHAVLTGGPGLRRLKANLVSVVIAVLAVLFMREAVAWNGERDIPSGRGRSTRTNRSKCSRLPPMNLRNPHR